MPTQRQLRVNNLLQQEIAAIIQRDLQDPFVGFTTVTGVHVTADLRHARVFVSVLGDVQEKADTIKALVRARGHIRGLLGDRIVLKSIPQLRFVLDETAERAQRIETLLRQSEVDLSLEDLDDASSDE